MNQKTFSTITLVVFLLIALLHVLRLVYGWSVVMGGFEVPMWMSYPAATLFVYLAYSAFDIVFRDVGLFFASLALLFLSKAQNETIDK